MKIESSILNEFIKKATIFTGGENHVITEFVMNFQDNGVTIEAIDDTSTTMVIGFLNKSAFVNYESFGKIGITNVTRLKKVLDRFDNMVELTKNESQLFVSEKLRKFVLMLPNIEIIRTSPKQPVLEYEYVFTIDSSFFVNALKNANILEKGLSIVFQGKDKVLTAYCGNDDKAYELINIPELSEEVSVKLGEPFRNVIPILDGSIQVSLKNNYPVKILTRTEQMTVSYIVAPLTAE